MEYNADEKTPEQKAATANLRKADVLLSQARYLANREDVSADGLEWVSAPDFQGAVKSIDKVIELLEDVKAVLTEEERKRKFAELAVMLLGEEPSK
jgi:hypothetical protein